MLIKLSHSILNAWASGRYDDAIGYYLGKDIPPTPAMELGRVKDKLWSQYAVEKKQRHPDLGGGKLVAPQIQLKLDRRLKFSDEFEILFRGVIDEMDGETLTDYKCGRMEPSYYMSGYQLDCYHLLAPKTKIGQYICHNPYTKKTSIGIKYFSDETIDRALNFILTNAGEFINYAQALKVLRDYQL